MSQHFPLGHSIFPFLKDQISTGRPVNFLLYSGQYSWYLPESFVLYQVPRLLLHPSPLSPRKRFKNMEILPAYNLKHKQSLSFYNVSLLLLLSCRSLVFLKISKEGKRRLLCCTSVHCTVQWKDCFDLSISVLYVKGRSCLRKRRTLSTGTKHWKQSIFIRFS